MIDLKTITEPFRIQIDPATVVLRPWLKYGIFGCTYGRRCGCKSLSLQTDGIAVGSLPSPLDPWRIQHGGACDGNLVQILEPISEPPVSPT